MTIPNDHVEEKEIVFSNLNKLKNSDYIGWIGHATFLIKLGGTTIITDPVFSKNAGPLIFGPKRYVDPALSLNEIPKVDLFLLTHNHYDHQDTATIRKFPYKDADVIMPLKLGKYFTKHNYKKVNELDWYQTVQINDLKITLLPAVHWAKSSLTDTNKTLWGNFLIEYKDKKILFACDTGVGKIYKEVGDKFGPIDLTLINIGAYNFYPMTPYKDKSAYHTNPEEALSIARDLKSKKVIGMHWGTFVLSLEPIMEPRKRFKNYNLDSYKSVDRNEAVDYGGQSPINSLIVRMLGFQNRGNKDYGYVAVATQADRNNFSQQEMPKALPKALQKFGIELRVASP